MALYSFSVLIKNKRLAHILFCFNKNFVRFVAHGAVPQKCSAAFFICLWSVSHRPFSNVDGICANYVHNCQLHTAN